MIDIRKIESIATQKLQGTDMFVIGVKCSPANEVEVIIDSDTVVSIDDCVALSREIESQLDREVEDFELTVASAGIGQPLTILRQYTKLTGKSVEVVLKNGVKIIAKLSEVTADAITLCYTEKVAVEGKKRKVETNVCKQYTMDEIKSTKEYIDFK